MSRNFITVDLEQGMPSTDVALKRLSDELITAKAHRVKVVKIIHGYGSSGVGGKIRTAIHKELDNKKKKGQIKAWVPGEKWEIFSMEAIKILDAGEELRNDRDLGQYNAGISMVLL